jgi:1-acyl-sn-glycerol-3-phosphate acyltransferase
MSPSAPIDSLPEGVVSRQSRWTVPLSKLLLFLFSNYHTEGLENRPEPPYILVANHLSYVDIPTMMHVTPPGVIGFAARKYKDTWKEPFFKMNSVIWITQFSADREALRFAVQVLEKGGMLAVAPEGTRSKTGGLGQGREGAAFLATRANVPILPAALWGTEKVFHRPRPRVTVRVGKPFRLPEGRAKGDQLAEYTEQIMCAIAALLPEKYHGIYAGNPRIAEMAKIVR